MLQRRSRKLILVISPYHGCTEPWCVSADFFVARCKSFTPDFLQWQIVININWVCQLMTVCGCVVLPMVPVTVLPVPLTRRLNSPLLLDYHVHMFLYLLTAYLIFRAVPLFILIAPLSVESCGLSFLSVCLLFTALHGMQSRSCDEISVCLSVCPSVCPSVKRVHCDKTEESYV